MLSEQMLKMLRDWYRAARPTKWMFQGLIYSSHITRAGVLTCAPSSCCWARHRTESTTERYLRRVVSKV